MHHSTDNMWHGPNDEQPTVGYHLLRSIPTGVPHLVEPTPLNDKLLNELVKWVNGKYLSNEANLWFQELIQSKGLNIVDQTNPPEDMWQLPHVREFTPSSVPIIVPNRTIVHPLLNVSERSQPLAFEANTSTRDPIEKGMNIIFWTPTVLHFGIGEVLAVHASPSTLLSVKLYDVKKENNGRIKIAECCIMCKLPSKITFTHDWYIGWKM
jgi:hypothetical protein